MRLLLLLALVPPVVVAADPPPVPKTWEKVSADAAGGSQVVAHAGHTLWVTKVLVPGTAMNRAQSFTETLYRVRAGDRQAEQLERVATTHGLSAILGPNGEVASGWFADSKTLYVPGLKPISMPQDGRFAPQEWATDGLVCAAERWVAKTPGQRDGRHEAAVLRFPIDRAKNAVGEPAVLRPWLPYKDDEFKPNVFNGRAFARGDFVVWTGTVPNPARPGFPRDASEVWDTKAGKAVWREEVTVTWADDTYAYWSADHLTRRRLDGTGATEQLAGLTAAEAVGLDFRPPHLFALVKQEKAWVLTRFDLTTGGRTEYDLRLAGGKPGYTYSASGPVRRFTVWPDGDSSDGWKAAMPLGLDATAGEARIVRDGAVYRIPVAKKLPADAPPKWQPAGGK